MVRLHVGQSLGLSQRGTGHLANDAIGDYRHGERNILHIDWPFEQRG